MRVVQKTITPNLNIEGDLKLVRLASPSKSSEPSEECFIELSRALREALEVIEKSIQE